MPLPEREPFGAAVVTSVGSLGLARVFAPLVSWMGASMVLAPGAAVEEPVVDGDSVRPGKVMWLCCAFDHRLVDGSRIAILAESLRSSIEDPAYSKSVGSAGSRW